MSCRSRTSKGVLAVMTVTSAFLGGCSDIYFDRRETIVPNAGDAMAANRVAQMVDPWPPSSANRNIAFNGEVMQRAVERYREGRVIPPVNATTSSVAYARAQASSATAAQSVRNSTASSNSGAPSSWATQQSQTAAPAQPNAPMQAQQSQAQASDSLQSGETR